MPAMPADYAQRYGPWALVTGASSGLGAEFARQLGARGLNVILVARRRDRLDALTADIERDSGVDTRVVELDLTDAGAPDAIAAAIADLEIGLLVNNAGFGEKGDFFEIPLAQQLRMVELNCKAPVWLTHTVGGAMLARGRGGIIVVASTGAFQGLPFSAVYGATKGFDLQLGAGLWYELRGRGVDVLSVCPGPTDTEGPRRTGVNADKVPVKMMPVEPVVALALDKLGKRMSVVPGLANKTASWLTRLLPRSVAARIAGRMIQRVSE
jgi:hypothetical protein